MTTQKNSTQRAAGSMKKQAERQGAAGSRISGLPAAICHLPVSGLPDCQLQSANCQLPQLGGMS